MFFRVINIVLEYFQSLLNKLHVFIFSKIIE